MSSDRALQGGYGSLRGGYAFLLQHYIFENEFVEVNEFGEVARNKAHGVELGVVEDVRFHKHRRGYVERLAYVRKVCEKGRIRKLIRALESNLINNFSVFDDLSPNSEHS